jgi:predicted nucleotidyltransferase
MTDALFPRTRQRVLSLLFGQPDRSFGTMELIELASSGSGAVQRELDRLMASGLVTSGIVGRQKVYRANRESPIFHELHGIVEKTAGVTAALRACLVRLAPAVRFAVLYGSVAKETDRATSDIDILLVADGLDLEAVFTALQPAEQALGRRVSPTVYTTEEFQRRRKARQPFLTKLLTGKHVVLLGSEDAIAAR